MWRHGFGRYGLLSILLLASPSHAMSLREAVQQAVLTNPRIEAAQANQRATTFGLKQARGQAVPGGRTER